MPSPLTPLLVDIPTAAGLLSLGLRTVESMVAKGEIDSRKIRTRRLIPMSDVERRRDMMIAWEAYCLGR